MNNPTAAETKIIARATRLGATAFQDGYNDVPNRSLIRLVSENQYMGEEIRKAYRSGWEQASRDQSVPFVEGESAD